MATKPPTSYGSSPISPQWKPAPLLRQRMAIGETPRCSATRRPTPRALCQLTQETGGSTVAPHKICTSYRSFGKWKKYPQMVCDGLCMIRFTTLDCKKTCFDNDFSCSITKVNTSAALKWADRRHSAQSPGGFDQETWHWLTGQRKSKSQLELPLGLLSASTSGIMIGIYTAFCFDQQLIWKPIGRKPPQDCPLKPPSIENFNCHVRSPAGIPYPTMVIFVTSCEPWPAAAAKQPQVLVSRLRQTHKIDCNRNELWATRKSGGQHIVPHHEETCRHSRNSLILPCFFSLKHND